MRNSRSLELRDDFSRTWLPKTAKRLYSFGCRANVVKKFMSWPMLRRRPCNSGAASSDHSASGSGVIRGPFAVMWRNGSTNLDRRQDVGGSTGRFEPPHAQRSVASPPKGAPISAQTDACTTIAAAPIRRSLRSARVPPAPRGAPHHSTATKVPFGDDERRRREQHAVLTRREFGDSRRC